MSRHSFTPEIAKFVGVNAAVIYQNIVFWCERNAAREHNIYEGNAWTYNSNKAFSALFPYLSERQIRTALDKLEEAELVVVDCFNKDPRDRTKWYAVHDETVMMHLTRKSAPSDLEVQPLPDSKPDINLPLNPQGEIGLFSEMETEDTQSTFDEFWKAYPKKTGKPAAQKAWDVQVKTVNPSLIIEGAKRYAHWLANPKKGEFRPHLKHPQGWLNSGRWADEEIWLGAADPEKASWEMVTDRQEALLLKGQCPPSMQNNDGTPNALAAALLATLVKP